MTKPRTCIIGLGLMGGSLALAWQASRSCSEIVGVTRSVETGRQAMAAGAVQQATASLPEGVAGADLIVLAAPVRTILAQLPAVGAAARPGAVILDLASTKQQVCEALAALPAGLEPIGGHPMCGKERNGFAAAEATLFNGRVFALCPLERTHPASFELVASMVGAIGARPFRVDPEQHDRAVAAISHLPYAVAVSLVQTVGAEDSLAWQLAASGYRDTSRVAESDDTMMLDILLTNREAFLAALDRFDGELAGLRRELAEGEEDALRARLARARTLRRLWREDREQSGAS